MPHGLQAARCSFPRIDGARFGVPPDTHPGDRVLHLACGNGALTKLLFSSGLQVCAVLCCEASAHRLARLHCWSLRRLPSRRPPTAPAGHARNA